MKKEFIVLAAIIVLLAGILFLHKRNNVNYTIPSLKSIKDKQITKLVIKDPKEEITLAKAGDTWEIKPQGYKADAKKISSMISKLSKLSISALVSEEKHYNVYDLSNDKKISVEAYVGDNVVRDLDIGKPSTSYRQTYVLLSGDKNVYLADGNIKSVFNTSSDRLRDMTVMAFDDDISSVAFTSGKKSIVLEKTTPPPDMKKASKKKPAPQHKPQWLAADGKNASASMINDAINTMRHLTCLKYITDKDKDKMGTPIYTITLKGSKDYSISLFAKNKDNQYPAISSENKYPFYLSEWNAKKLMPNEKTLFPAAKK